MRMDIVKNYLWLYELESDESLLQIIDEPENDEEKFAAIYLLMASPSNERKAE